MDKVLFRLIPDDPALLLQGLFALFSQELYNKLKVIFKHFI